MYVCRAVVEKTMGEGPREREIERERERGGGGTLRRQRDNILMGFPCSRGF